MHINHRADFGDQHIKPFGGKPARFRAQPDRVAELDKRVCREKQKVAEEAARRTLQLVARTRGVSEAQLLQPNRGKAHIAQSRQLAMYLLHVSLAFPMKEVGRFFNRDRTTVAHACATIEDLRDDPKNKAFENLIGELEICLQAVLLAEKGQ